MLVVFLGCAVLYSNLFGFVGIALANVTAFTLEALLLLYLLNRKLPGVVNVWDSLPRIAIAAIVGSFVVFAILNWAPFHPAGRLMNAVWGIAVLGVGGIVSFPFIWKEAKMLVKL